MTLILLGQVLELRARSQTSGAIKKLLGMAAKTARRVREDGAEEVPSIFRAVNDLPELAEDLLDVGQHPIAVLAILQEAPHDAVACHETTRDGVEGARDGLHVVDGWLHSGDEGIESADGTVRFVGLRKAMFTRNGFNIYPRELERVIGELRGVDSVRVWNIPDPARENDIGVEVTGTVTAADVRAWCESQLSVYKQPTVIHA